MGHLLTDCLWLQEEEELYTLQIKSAAQEVKVRDRHLVMLEQDVEKAREAAAIQHEEIMKMGASSWKCSHPAV